MPSARRKRICGLHSLCIFGITILLEFTARCVLTPAMEAGLADHVWELEELLTV
jgi:hypothetical protein